MDNDIKYTYYTKICKSSNTTILLEDANDHTLHVYTDTRDGKYPIIKIILDNDFDIPWYNISYQGLKHLDSIKDAIENNKFRLIYTTKNKKGLQLVFDDPAINEYIEKGFLDLATV